MQEFDLIIQGVSGRGQNWSPFCSQYSFVPKIVCEKQLFFNEIYSPIFEKKKFLSANKRSVFQLFDVTRLNDKGKLTLLKLLPKPMRQWMKKITILLYAEHLHFLLTRYGWKVIKIRGHYSFEQKQFKKDFVIMKQVSRRNAKTDVEKEKKIFLN